MKLSENELQEFLGHYHDKYNCPDFIENDPISIPHQFTKKEDVEISGFLAASIAWGKREMIVKNANEMISLMDRSPYDFVLNHKKSDLDALANFKHRTFNGVDFIHFVTSLSNIYKHHGGLEKVMAIDSQADDTKEALIQLNNVFFEQSNHPLRTKKHVSNPQNGSASKRLNMFYRWMVRSDGRGVDFGIWRSMKSSQLICPLDVHTGNISRKLGLLSRNQNDWKAAKELSENLKKYDKFDPVKYDFALFGAGINKDL